MPSRWARKASPISAAAAQCDTRFPRPIRGTCGAPELVALHHRICADDEPCRKSTPGHDKLNDERETTNARTRTRLAGADT
jgi:hypothetical protein